MGNRYKIKCEEFSIFCDIMPCSLLKINRCFRGTLADFQWTAKFYIPEDTTLYNPGQENFKSYKIKFVSGKDRNGTIWGKVLKNAITKFKS